MRLTLRKLPKVRIQFRDEPLSTTAHLLDKLVGVTRGSQGRMHFGWQLETYLNIPEIRDSAARTDSELEEMI